MYKCLLKKLNSMAVEYAIPCGFQVHLTHDSWWARLGFLLVGSKVSLTAKSFSSLLLTNVLIDHHFHPL